MNSPKKTSAPKKRPGSMICHPEYPKKVPRKLENPNACGPGCPKVVLNQPNHPQKPGPLVENWRVRWVTARNAPTIQ